jgi:hypothetical protein
MLMVLILLDEIKEVDVEINADKSKYIFMSRHQNIARNHIKLDNRSFETVEKLKYLDTTVKNQILVHKAISSRFTSGNSYYNLVQNFLYSLMASQKLKF